MKATRFSMVGNCYKFTPLIISAKAMTNEIMNASAKTSPDYGFYTVLPFVGPTSTSATETQLILKPSSNSSVFAVSQSAPDGDDYSTKKVSREFVDYSTFFANFLADFMCPILTQQAPTQTPSLTPSQAPTTLAPSSSPTSAAPVSAAPTNRPTV